MSFDSATLAVFLLATATLNITPGPDMMYIMARGVGQGRRAGLVSALGLSIGYVVHTLATAFGLAALLRTSVMAFAIVKYVGAAYLMYLGVRTLATRKGLAETDELEQASAGRIFWQGTLTSVLNPKVALFFLAFLPQFANPARGSVVGQIVVLGILFSLSATLFNSAAALLSSTLGSWLRTRPHFSTALNRFTGGVFLALGVRIALTRRS